MALQYVGGTSGVGTSTGYAVSLSGTLTGGIASSPAAGDIVVVFSGFANTASSAPSVSGNNSGVYIGATAAQNVNDAWDTEFRSFYQEMGATPDTSLTITRVTNAAYGGGTTVQVWRNADQTSPFVGAATPVDARNTSLVNPPAYNPAVTGAVIIAGGAGTQDPAGVAFTGFAGMSNFVSAYGDGTTADMAVGMASYDYAGVSYDPPIVSGGTGGNSSSSWAGVTIALRPAVSTGSMDATEAGSDTFAATGTVSSSGVTGSMAATEVGADVFAADGDVFIAGSMAATEAGADVFSATGDVFVSGSMDATETGSDVFASTGDVLVQGTFAATETGSDVFAATGTVGASGITGTMAATETGSDVFAAAGDVLVQGALAAVESGSDVFAATGTAGATGITGTMAAIESGSDTASISGSTMQMGGGFYKATKRRSPGGWSIERARLEQSLIEADEQRQKKLDLIAETMTASGVERAERIARKLANYDGGEAQSESLQRELIKLEAESRDLKAGIEISADLKAASDELKEILSDDEDVFAALSQLHLHERKLILGLLGVNLQ